MQPDEARAGRHVTVTLCQTAYLPNLTRTHRENRTEIRAGTMVAPYPGTDGSVWIVRDPRTMRTSAFYLDELTPAGRGTGTFRDWGRTPEQQAGASRAERSDLVETATEAARRRAAARDRARRQAAAPSDAEELAAFLEEALGEDVAAAVEALLPPAGAEHDPEQAGRDEAALEREVTHCLNRVEHYQNLLARLQAEQAAAEARLAAFRERRRRAVPLPPPPPAAPEPPKVYTRKLEL